MVIRQREAADESVSCLILEAVAETRGISTTEIEPPLYEAIDPDALDALFDAEFGTPRSVEFTFSGCQITVQGDGGLTVRTIPVDGASEAERGVA